MLLSRVGHIKRLKHCRQLKTGQQGPFQLSANHLIFSQRGFFDSGCLKMTSCKVVFFVFQLVLVLVAVVAVVVYRAAVFAVLAAQGSYNVGAVNIATSATAALINLVIIMILNKVRIH